MDKYERFEAWLRDNGAQFEMLEMREYPDDGLEDDEEEDSLSNHHHDDEAYNLEEEKKEPSGSSGYRSSNCSHHNSTNGTTDETIPIHPMTNNISSSTHTTINPNTTTSTTATRTDTATTTTTTTATTTNRCRQRRCRHRNPHESSTSSSEMRGVHAKCHVPSNTICMSIPRKCLITVEMGQATPIGQLIASYSGGDLDLDAPKHVYLMIYLLWDSKLHGTSSFFHPYYEILPKTLSNMPIFWNSTELSYLQGSALLEQIQDRNMAIAEDYHTIGRIAPMLYDICTLEEFAWARMCVCSRNFGLSMDGHRTSALVPYADMLNHYRPRETKWTFDEERQAFTITTLQPIPVGAQVYDSYGQKCNHRFLLNYGFAVEDNRELDGFCPNEVAIELTLPFTSTLPASSSSNHHNHNQEVEENVIFQRSKLEFWLSTISNNGGGGTELPMGSGSSSSIGGGTTAFPQHFKIPTHPSFRHSLSMPSHTALAPAVASVEAAANNHNATNRLHPHTIDNGGVNTSNGGGSSTMTASRESLVSDVEAAVQYRNRRQQQQQLPYDLAGWSSSSSSSSNYQHQSLQAAMAATGLSKRVRVCVSNNENTRLLFSLLRAAVCNEDELVAITAPVTTTSTAAAATDGSLFGMGRPLPPQVPPPPPPFSHNFFESLSSSSSSRVYYRSCRDIRHPISIRNERAAMQLLLETVGRQLEQYPNSLAQDVADLMDERAFPRFSNKRHAKIQVRGEKEVLHHFGQWARTALQLLQVVENEVIQERQAMMLITKSGSINHTTTNAVTTTTTATISSSSNHPKNTNSAFLPLSGRPATSNFGYHQHDDRYHNTGRGGGDTTLLSNFWSVNTAVAIAIRRSNSSNNISSSEGGNSGGGGGFQYPRTNSGSCHFDQVIQSMEDDETGLHHTIVRYCADVLGSLRREELKNLKRQRALLWNTSNSHHHDTSGNRSSYQ